MHQGVSLHAKLRQGCCCQALGTIIDVIRVDAGALWWQGEVQRSTTTLPDINVCCCCEALRNYVPHCSYDVGSQMLMYTGAPPRSLCLHEHNQELRRWNPASPLVAMVKANLRAPLASRALSSAMPSAAPSPGSVPAPTSSSSTSARHSVFCCSASCCSLHQPVRCREPNRALSWSVDRHACLDWRGHCDASDASVV